LPHQAS